MTPTMARLSHTLVTTGAALTASAAAALTTAAVALLTLTVAVLPWQAAALALSLPVGAAARLALEAPAAWSTARRTYARLHRAINDRTQP